MITLVIIIIVYLLTILGAYKFIQYAHYHEKGTWKMLDDPETSDWIFVIFPITSFLLTIAFLFGLWKDPEYRRTMSFKPKN
jgi:TRAP-type C4-dicarboxylate transport system permease small subunit